MTLRQKLNLITLLFLLILLSARVKVEGANTKIVQIGVIAPQTSTLETLVPIVEMAEEDINRYMEENDHNYRFEFLIDDAQSQAAIHLEKVQSYKAMDVNLVIGGGWSSQAQASLNYVNENDMLLLSPSSTSPLLAIPNDNLFRLSPDDFIQVPAMAEMLWSWGIKAVVVIQRGDSWADGIYNILKIDYPAKGGVILEDEKAGRDRIRYAPEATEFSGYLATAEYIMEDAVEQYGKDHLAIVAISFSEIATMVTQAKDYPTIYSLYWFGSEGTALTRRLLDNAPEESDHLKIFSTVAALPDSKNYVNLYARYYAVTSQPLGFYTATYYDACWLYALSIIMEGTADPIAVKSVLPSVAANYMGVSGWCKLNEAGDRYTSNYDIWGYGYESGEPSFIKYGYYDGISGKVMWMREKSTISCLVSSFNVIKGEDLTVSGSIIPSLSDETVTLTYIRSDGSTYTKNVKTYEDGTYQDTYTPDQLGKWFVQAFWEGDATYSGTTSQFLEFSVIGRARSLTIQSQQGSVSGEGSYREGSTATFSVSPTTVSRGSGVHYIFTGWTSDNPGGYTGTDNPAEVVMNNDIIETAVWKKQYLLTVSTPVDVEGDGWYDEGSTATLRAVSPQGFLVRQVFKGWSGDIHSESETVSVVIDRPKTVIAEWTTDYTQLYMLGGLASVVVISAGAISLQRRRAERRRQARVELKENLLNELIEAREAVSIDRLAEKYSVSEDVVRQLIDEALQEGALQGRYTNDEQRFITDAALQNIIREKFRKT